MLNLPQEFKERMKGILGDQYDKFLFSYNEKPTRGVRINTKKVGNKITLPFTYEDTPFASNCKYLIGEEKYGNHPYSHAGLFYMQEPAAMMPANCLNISPDWKVLDLCACPGGKSGQVANQLTNGLLFSNEIITSRSKILFSNMERQGFTNVVVTNDTPQKFASVLPNFFDLVIVDAPCSGEGMFRKEPSAITEWSLTNVQACAIRQQEILNSAKECVKPNGYMIYSTCTFSIEENEKIVLAFLNANDNFELLPVNSDIQKITSDGIVVDKNIELRKCRRCYPHITRGEGQFMALFHRTDDGVVLQSKNKSLKTLSSKEEKLVNDFLKKYTDIENLELRIANNNIYSIPKNLPELKNIRIVNCGVQVGSIIKDRFEPTHSLFIAYGTRFKNKVNLDCQSMEIQKYLSGETLFRDTDNGWGVITVDEYPLGGFKAVDGQLKNHYPKGLRK